jgi:hypothetical protein
MVRPVGFSRLEFSIQHSSLLSSFLYLNNLPIDRNNMVCGRTQTDNSANHHNRVNL